MTTDYLRRGDTKGRIPYSDSPEQWNAPETKSGGVGVKTKAPPALSVPYQLRNTLRLDWEDRP